jgi:hypothetical protein
MLMTSAHLPHDHRVKRAVSPGLMKPGSVSRPAVQAFVGCLVWVAACVVLAGPAHSADVIYKYVDEQGIPHYTDRRDLIPEKFRSKVQAIDSAKSPVTVVPTPPSPPRAPGEPPPSSWLDQFTEFSTSGLGLTIAGVLLVVLAWRFFRR